MPCGLKMSHHLFPWYLWAMAGQKTSHDYCGSFGSGLINILKCKAYMGTFPVFPLNFSLYSVLSLFLLFLILRCHMKVARSLALSVLTNSSARNVCSVGWFIWGCIVVGMPCDWWSLVGSLLTYLVFCHQIIWKTQLIVMGAVKSIALYPSSVQSTSGPALITDTLAA